MSTCGEGLAANSILPAKLAEVVRGVEGNLEAHLPALDPDDADARREHEAYAELLDEHRRLADALEALAAKMAGYRDLPMGSHDTAAMTSPRVAEAFDRLMRAEADLAALLAERLPAHRELLATMRQPRDSPT
jgi:hypothetical protein